MAPQQQRLGVAVAVAAGVPISDGEGSGLAPKETEAVAVLTELMLGADDEEGVTAAEAIAGATAES